MGRAAAFLSARHADRDLCRHRRARSVPVGTSTRRAFCAMLNLCMPTASTRFSARLETAVSGPAWIPAPCVSMWPRRKSTAPVWDRSASNGRRRTSVSVPKPWMTSRSRPRGCSLAARAGHGDQHRRVVNRLTALRPGFVPFDNKRSQNFWHIKGRAQLSQNHQACLFAQRDVDSRDSNAAD